MELKNIKCELCKKQAEHEHHKDNNHKNNKPENKQYLCTLCHAKIHGIEPKKSELKRQIIFRDRIIITRNALDNQIRGLERIEYIIPKKFTEERDNLNKLIKEHEKNIKQLMKSGKYPVWNEFLEPIKGISYITAGKLIAYIDITKAPNVSSLWRYCGLDASRIKRLTKITQEEAKTYGSPYLKKELLGILADSFIKQRTPIYREIYDNEKERQIKRHLNNECERCTKYKLQKKPGHAHAMAKRKSVKMFLSHFWQEWRKIEKLPVTEPYAFAILNHSKKIEPIMPRKPNNKSEPYQKRKPCYKSEP